MRQMTHNIPAVTLRYFTNIPLSQLTMQYEPQLCRSIKALEQQKKVRKVGRPKLPKGTAMGRIVPVRFTGDDLKAIAIRAKAGKSNVSGMDSEHDSCQPSKLRSSN